LLRTTHTFRFEAKVRDWAERLRASLTEGKRDALLVASEANGRVRELHVRGREGHAELLEIRERSRSWLFCDPFEPPRTPFSRGTR
jgi:hypothetical protein